jgi:4'-phosphopantetheinyl transferase
VTAAARVRLILRHAAQPQPEGEAWLSEAERSELARFRIDKRRFEWRLGRAAAKQLVAAELGLPFEPAVLARTEIRAAPDGAPEPFLDGRPLDLALSISHSAGLATCAIAGPGVALGCDVELIRALRRGTVSQQFTAAEQRLMEGLEPHDWAVRGTLLWTAKESALKALRQGLRLDTRAVEAMPSLDDSPGTWRPLAVAQVAEGRVFRGWWRRLGDHIISVVAEPGAEAPAGEDAPAGYLRDPTGAGV